jgi:hypothetical protein
MPPANSRLSSFAGFPTVLQSPREKPFEKPFEKPIQVFIDGGSNETALPGYFIKI